MNGDSGDWPKFTFPPEEAEYVRSAYASARVILEYGSGGSTMIGAVQPGKLIFSVESDRKWALRLQHKLDKNAVSPVLIYHVDIGETGLYGRAIDDSSWRTFHKYPTRIWSERFFRHPDLILIDGRFRPACLIHACVRITRPVVVLFDDYVDRPKYHIVEQVIKPSRMIGRMAEFRISPNENYAECMQDLLLDLCAEPSFAAPVVDYSASSPID